ncbi:hypothetical protein SERLADRAFT_446117 [Serpula lacrymans var. lacrymans S7.9]|uniref:F-box domain-containing protein n=1 Tax=Serpula lacrymans var. lacrymans (strain S7.9) TaxID=578457 RepID=F8NJW9_SERL9|nr:uncharacterized protein SERLADRAFT_446117 [Serpula lacrymans var. lacrymans S7.9]EGO28705.1 hypothetical protein SERLADRAFT_446117 [Serpula lacrymans var. lacrymans S7.9]
MTCLSSLEAIPQEVLEHIVFFSTADNPLGPPAPLLSLLLTSQTIYRTLSISANPHLYARIFTHKFDIDAAIRRLGPQIAVATVLASELQRRCIILKRIRARLDSRLRSVSSTPQKDQMLGELLWMAYLMMLENDGKNERQLREYADIETWLREFWFDDDGASLAPRKIKDDQWPLNHERNSLAMWLFWFFLKPDQYKRNENFRLVTSVMKLTALAANRYPLCWPSWAEFIPEEQSNSHSSVTHFSETYQLTPPPLAAPAILSFFTFAVQLSGPLQQMVYKAPHAPSASVLITGQSYEWESDWQKCMNLGQARYSNTFSGAYIPGSIEGVWEGIFTYTEFTAYAALLSGAPPPILHRSLVAQHRQTWKLREYHLLETDVDSSSGLSDPGPLSPGDPLRAYFPVGTRIREHSNEIQIHEPGRSEPLRYQRPPSCALNVSLMTDNYTRSLKDIIVVGEGHSAWGQFNLIGRVRPCDGFVSLSKEYTEGDRGKWLYRCFLVGNSNGNLSGRWRDTLSPSHVSGYEGCFVMSRRR